MCVRTTNVCSACNQPSQSDSWTPCPSQILFCRDTKVHGAVLASKTCPFRSEYVSIQKCKASQPCGMAAHYEKIRRREEVEEARKAALGKVEEMKRETARRRMQEEVEKRKKNGMGELSIKIAEMASKSHTVVKKSIERGGKMKNAREVEYDDMVQGVFD